MLSANFQKGLTAAQSGDFANALREWTPLAKQGDPNSQYNLARIYHYGSGAPKNIAHTIKRYELSANQGHPFSQTNLGVIYEKGDGVSKDFDAAFRW